MSFKADMDRAYKNKVVDTQEKRVRATALAILADLTLQTPVDTGRARANWLPSFGSPRTTTVEADGGISQINFGGWKLGTSIFISNNLPYIRRLNEGWSKQAPASFVDKIVQVANLRAKSSFGRIL